VSLTTYRKKRKFTQTSEPKGKVKKSKQGSIFVVHEHWASHHHFDFRLEIDGVLKSWAVPKVLPQKAGEKRLAVQVEDHPLEYGSFKGTISEGQYGAGKVEIWDNGKLEIIEKEENSIKFQLMGKKLKGEYTIFHPPTFEEKNWLLMKK
jgi:DNA ligase D-like protein (predicted 3'-phosphoesterase)